jgi:hypothetical protein
MRKRRIWLTVWMLGLTAIVAACGARQHPYDLSMPSRDGGSQQSGHHQHASPEESSKWNGLFELTQEAVPNELSELRIRIQDRDRITLKQYEWNHEKLMHLIVVNRELTHFDHLHPDPLEQGSFAASVVFPAEGSYKLFADFVPKGGLNATVSDWITVGEPANDGKPALIPDNQEIKTAGGLAVSLSLSSHLAGEDVQLKFKIQDADTKMGITDLEPYLGAIGHVVILSSDAEQYLHVHPADDAGAGPEAVFVTTFPSAGSYKLWGQFKHGGELYTIPFVVEIAA